MQFFIKIVLLSLRDFLWIIIAFPKVELRAASFLVVG